MKTLAIVTIILTTCVTTTIVAAAPCGEERAEVKLGKDAGASSISTTPTRSSVEVLASLPRPRVVPARRRANVTEQTTWRVEATLVAYKIEVDGDYHLVIQDGAGHHMIVEIPSPACAAGGVWSSQIAAARAIAEGRLAKSSTLHRLSLPVVVTGVGFYDVLHGQVGVAPTGIELHPVLALEFVAE